MSKGEQAVEQVLTDLNIEFKREVMLSGLTNEIGTHLPVDFVIKVGKKLAIIEYNGDQHYRQIMDQVETFNCRVRNDATRVNYAAATGVPLLVIHYKDLSKIENIIKIFVGEVKSNCKKKRQYSSHSFGYFQRELSPIAPKIKDVFVPTHALNEPVATVDLKTPFPLTHNTEFGFVQVGSNESGAIIWTIEQLNQFTADLKREKAQIEMIKSENKQLIAKLSMSTNQLLELSKENTHLKIQVGELEEENEKLQAEVSELKQQLEQNENKVEAVVVGEGKVINQVAPFPSVVRKSNRTFTEEFKVYIGQVQGEYQFSPDELREYLAHFDVEVSDVTLRKMVIQ